MNTITSKVGRIIFAIPFGIFGLFHFMNANAMGAMVPIPGGAFWIYLTGAALLAACISIIIEKKIRLACILLGIMVLIFLLAIHLPAVIGAQSQQVMQAQLTSLLKDVALVGAAWFIAGQYSSEANTVEA